MKLKEYVKQNNITLSEMARSVGITPGYLSMVNRGKRRLSREVATRLNTLTKGKVVIEEFYPVVEPKTCPCCNRILPKNYKVQLKI
jgi:transcriptional regulator with XRE-family HTH domain